MAASIIRPSWRSATDTKERHLELHSPHVLSSPENTGGFPILVSMNIGSLRCFHRRYGQELFLACRLLLCSVPIVTICVCFCRSAKKKHTQWCKKTHTQGCKKTHTRVQNTHTRVPKKKVCQRKHTKVSKNTQKRVPFQKNKKCTPQKRGGWPKKRTEKRSQKQKTKRVLSRKKHKKRCPSKKMNKIKNNKKSKKKKRCQKEKQKRKRCDKKHKKCHPKKSAKTHTEKRSRKNDHKKSANKHTQEGVPKNAGGCKKHRRVPKKTGGAKKI